MITILTQSEGTVVPTALRPGRPTWTAPVRPAQRFVGNLLYEDRGDRMVDVYSYAGGEVYGLRYGAHPRDERTHSAEYWRRQTDTMAKALCAAFLEDSHE